MSDEQFEEVEEKILELYKICADLGWCVAINDSNEFVEGMLIGKHNYLLEILSNAKDFENYAIMDIIDPPPKEELH